MSKQYGKFHWQYRVMKDPMGGFGIYEVYFHEDGRIDAFTQDPVDLGYYDSVEELEKNLQWMLDSLKKPVLDYVETEKTIVAALESLSTRPDIEDDANPLYDKQL